MLGECSGLNPQNRTCTDLFWWMVKRLNHSSWSSLGRSIVTWLLTNILYKRSSGIEPTHTHTHEYLTQNMNNFTNPGRAETKNILGILLTAHHDTNNLLPRPNKASLVLPFCIRMGLISIFSTEWEWPKWLTRPEALSRSNAHRPSA